MKNKLYIIGLILAGSLGVSSCKNEYPLPDQPLSVYELVYMPQAVNGPVTKVLTLSQDPQSIVYGANAGGQDFPTRDINVKFEVSAALVASYNAANQTNYEMLPARSYTMGELEAVIGSGKNATIPLKIMVSTTGPNAIEMFKTYLLPVSILSSDYAINTSLKTTYFLISTQPNLADYPDFVRANWKIVDFSSQEANGEGPNNGKAIFLLDNNINSFWHSQWQNGNPGPPHHITVDMGETKELHGFVSTARQVDGNGKPNLVEISVSTDNVNWTTAGEYTLAFKKEPQKVFLKKFVPARYFKFTILSAYGSTNAHMSEIGAF